MKKEEKYTIIRKQAYEFARSGKCMNYLSVEHALNKKGWSEARIILNDTYFREEINQICKDAQSSSEIENRELFKKWIKDFIQKNVSKIKEKYPEINIYISENSFKISSSKKEIEISKMFNSKKLQGDYFFEESNGQGYKSSNYYHSEITFDDFTIYNLFNIVKIVL